MAYEITCLPKLWYVYLKPKLILHFSKMRTCKYVKLKKYTFNAPLIMLGVLLYFNCEIISNYKYII